LVLTKKEARDCGERERERETTRRYLNKTRREDFGVERVAGKKEEPLSRKRETETGTKRTKGSSGDGGRRRWEKYYIRYASRRNKME
jgi:hypothetical protein